MVYETEMLDFVFRENNIKVKGAFLASQAILQ